MAVYGRYERIPQLRQSNQHPEAETSWSICKIVILPEASTDPARVIPLPDAGSEETHYNSIGQITKAVDTLGIYFCREIEMMGAGFIFKSGQLVNEIDIIPTYVIDDVNAGRQWDLKPNLPRKKLEDLCIVFVSNAYYIYGHWLLDMLPKLWICKAFFGNLDGLKFIVPRGTPPWALLLIERFFEVRNLHWHEINNEVLELSNCFVPSLMHNDHYFHPDLNNFVSYLIGHDLVAPFREGGECLLYVTRRDFQRHSTSYRRSIINEEEVIATLTRLGFTVITPETLSWEEQIGIFSRASIIVGESGSGLHNAIFSPSNCCIICLNPQNHLQMTIGALRNHYIINQITEKEIIDGEMRFSVDIQRLEKAVNIAKSTEAYRERE